MTLTGTQIAAIIILAVAAIWIGIFIRIAVSSYRYSKRLEAQLKAWLNDDGR